MRWAAPVTRHRLPYDAAIFASEGSLSFRASRESLLFAASSATRDIHRDYGQQRRSICARMDDGLSRGL